ncbi:hypothetical protein PP637_gp83 [Arthrobacter phage Persistence]|uniref:Uncharacterized protein n=1 Tax=Arthrobacter phage Persistence TaxID=2836007 RepID=A0A8F3E663_9CAUD|nr:hypothetical protein PP637_gp83 [Arthrobacter phage Persistence]QWY79711.1 hypothetical protein SEA_PERSISTENCE_83 [Arthrobacter phage Persistence]
MTFPGKQPDVPQPPRPMRRFAYTLFNNGSEHEISAHEIYFYEAGRVGFWNYDDNGERVLVLGTKAFQVREVVGGGRET